MDVVPLLTNFAATLANAAVSSSDQLSLFEITLATSAAVVALANLPLKVISSFSALIKL